MDILAWSASACVLPTSTPTFSKHASVTSYRSQDSARSSESNSTGSQQSHFSADSSPATSSIDLSRTSSSTSNSSASFKYPPVTKKKSRHLRAFSDSTRRLQKKSPDDSPNRRSEPVMAPIVVPERITDTAVSDLLIRCRDDDYHVDRSIMCHHAQFFAKVYSKINYPRMSKRVVDLSAEDPGAVAAMIQYCYQLDYGGDCASVNTALYQIVTLRPHVDTFVLAERYGIPGLKKLALQKFESLATAMVKVDGNEDDFLRTVRYLYDPPRRNKADVLRRVALKLCADHLGTTVLGIGKTVSGMVTLMEEIPEFRSDLFEVLATRWK